MSTGARLGRGRIIALLLLIAATGTARAADTEPRQPQGPLVAHNLHPLYAPFIQFFPHRATTVGANTIAVFAYTSYGNNFFYDPPAGGQKDVYVILDSEAVYTTLGITWGIHPRAEVNASILAETHFGGLLDPALEAYHNLFGFPNASREKRPQRDVRFYFENDDGVLIDESSPLADMTALTLEPRVEIIEENGGPFMLAGSIALKLPLSAPSITLTRSGTDVAVRLFADYDWPTASISASLGVGYLSQPDYIPETGFVPWILPFSLSFEWMATDTFSAVTTVTGNTSPFRLGYERTDRFTAIATMGGSFALSDRLHLQAGLSEEFFTFAATDVALHFALRYRFAQAWEPQR